MKFEAQEAEINRLPLRVFNVSSGTTMTGTESEPLYVLISGKRLEFNEREAGNAFEHILRIPVMQRHLWCWYHFVRNQPSGFNYVLSHEAIEENFVSSEDFDVGSFSVSTITEEEELEYPWQGLFCVSHAKDVIFSKTVKFETSKLPPWKPHIIIDRDILERSDE